MTPRRSLLLLLALAWALMTSGCASWVEFKMPERFKDKKQKEDPPGAFYIPPARTGAC